MCRQTITTNNNQNLKQMKTYEMKEFTPVAEIALLKQIFEDYKKDTNTIGLTIKSAEGTFINFGGFNGNPSDLWLKKKGTKGCTKKTFWRTSFGSKKSGFKIFCYDLRTVKITYQNKEQFAIDNNLNFDGTYYTLKSGL